MISMSRIEFRTGAGGDDALDFAAYLADALLAWAGRHGVQGAKRTDSPATRGVDVTLPGIPAAGMAWFTGTHRRMSVVGRNGRQTSYATVTAVDDVRAVMIQVRSGDPDIRIEACRSSGPGGQGVNTTDSAVRVTHIPTDTVVTCQDERSQTQNKEKALAELRRRLSAAARSRGSAQARQARADQVGDGTVAWTHTSWHDKVTCAATGQSWTFRKFAQGWFDGPAPARERTA